MSRFLFDTSGLCQWYAYLRQPSGIQRVVERILGTADVALNPSVEMISRPPGADAFYVVDSASIAALSKPGEREEAIARVRRQFADGMRLSRLPRLIREARLMHVPYTLLGWSSLGCLLGPAPFTAREKARSRIQAMTDGDVFIGLGDYWCHEGHAAAIASLKKGSRAKIVHMVHDLFAIEHPEWTHPYYGQLIRRSLNDLCPHVDAWLVNSAYVASSLSDYLARKGLPKRPIDVIPMGGDHFDSLSRADDSKILARYGLTSGTYLLHVGTIEPRKGIAILLRAVRQVAVEAGRWPIRCVFVGREGWRSEELRRQLAAAGEAFVTWLKDVPDEHMPAIYRGARYSVTPSLAEGWGFAVQESLVQGTPCIASRVGAITEVGRDLVTYFEVGNVNALAGLIREWTSNDPLVNERRARISAEPRLKGRFPTWETAARSVLSCATRALA